MRPFFEVAGGWWLQIFWEAGVCCEAGLQSDESRFRSLLRDHSSERRMRNFNESRGHAEIGI
jgi:hypothetical protein